MAAVSRHYDQKDLSSYAFRKEAKDNGDDPTATPFTNRTTTTPMDPMASPYTDMSGHGGALASPRTIGSQSPFSIHNGTFEGTPPPGPASPFQEFSTPAREVAGAAVEEISSAEFAGPAPETPDSSVEMTHIRG